jgi:hypothetical protein
LYPLTGFRIFTAAPGTTAPDGSVTVPAITPEFPVWAGKEVARNPEIRNEAACKKKPLRRQDARIDNLPNISFDLKNFGLPREMQVKASGLGKSRRGGGRPDGKAII